MTTVDRRERERRQREREILDAAERVFLAKGFEMASMDEIARESDFSKPTLYQYFRDKESLYLAVATRALGKLREAMLADAESGSAWERILRRAENLFSFCEANPGLFRMAGALGEVRPDAAEPRPERDSLAAFNDALFHDVARLLGEGQAEGSVARDRDPFVTACQLMFVMTGFMNLWALNGKTFSEHFGFEGPSFARGALGLILSSVACKEAAAVEGAGSGKGGRAKGAGPVSKGRKGDTR